MRLADQIPSWAQLHARGMTAAGAAAERGTLRRAAMEWAKANGVAWAGDDFAAKHSREIISMAKQGIHPAAIARKLECSKTSVTSITLPPGVRWAKTPDAWTGAEVAKLVAYCNQGLPRDVLVARLSRSWKAIHHKILTLRAGGRKILWPGLKGVYQKPLEGSVKIVGGVQSTALARVETRKKLSYADAMLEQAYRREPMGRAYLELVRRA